ncbi:MAG: hypothetical protein JO332_03625 [Planctomycetaceae bacterium]|nr:hypothetical protein [Planctomycetaceae bacterium]
MMLSFGDTNSSKAVKASVDRKGLCGDVFLIGEPAAARIADVRVETSVRKESIAFDVAVQGLAGNAACTLQAKVEGGPEFTSAPFKASDLQEGRLTFGGVWKGATLWDTHAPQNLYRVQLSLRDADGKTLDAALPQKFGFREFWIDGRDFRLNGTRIFLSAVPLDSAQVGARTASYEGARETLRRLQAFGINFVYTHNYGCEPGTHLGFDEVLRAADDVGMLVAFSQPHFGQYEWKKPDSDQQNGYAAHADYYVRVAQNHPSVVAYSMSHNATGYDEDMNPDQIDGLKDPRTDAWSRHNAAAAVRAEAIVRKLDPSRIVYHHSSGNLGSMHTCNFYVNFAPVQELSDWFGHWATAGVKPMFTVEYGVPFSWDWTLYRGWHNGTREWGSANVPWEFCLAEWNAQFLGDRAYALTDAEKRNLHWEAARFKAGIPAWHRWDYPFAPGWAGFEQQQEVLARYITDNWRAYRTWGLSANSPWEYAMYWKLREGADRAKKEFKTDWDRLQRPGFSPDFSQRVQGIPDLDYERDDWIPTAAGEALLRNNRPLLGYIAGKKDAFTSKDHVFRPGETVEKQLIVINNSREPLSVDCEWSLALPEPVSGKATLRVNAGDQERLPLRLPLPAALPPGPLALKASFVFGGRGTQTDSFTLDILKAEAPAPEKPAIALFDPKGETAALLKRLGVEFRAIEAATALNAGELLIVGKGALTSGGAAPDIRKVRDGLKVLLFEQTSKVLEERFGFRVTEYGLRDVFPRVPKHPALGGLEAAELHDWRGEATLLPPRLDYTLRPRYGPTVQWCGIEVPRAWRCGNRGNVASVLIEKPPCGDFLALVDGGFGLQYSPLLEYHEGKGLVLFCQLDVTGRTETEPAADVLTLAILRHAATWTPKPARTAVYLGDPSGKAHLEAAGFKVADSVDALGAGSVLILGAGGGTGLDEKALVAKGVRILALPLEGAEGLKKTDYVGSTLDAASEGSVLEGVGAADLLSRDPRLLALLKDSAVGTLNDGALTYCQLVPWDYDAHKSMNLKRTFRRASLVVSRLAANLGVPATTPLLERFGTPAERNEGRWFEGLYLERPDEWDDPYRYFRW